MKKIIALLFLGFVVSFWNNCVFAEAGFLEVKEKEPFQLQLKIKGYSNGPVKLFGMYGDQNFRVDSAFVDVNGSVIFKKDSALLGGLYLVVFPDLSMVRMLVDEDQQYAMEFDKNDVVNSMKVKGSLENELFYKNLKFEAVNGSQMDSLQKYLREMEKGSDAYTQLEAQIQKLKDERKAHIKSFSEKYPDNFFTKFKIAGQNPELKKILKSDGAPDDAAQVYYYRNEFWDGYDFSDTRLLRTTVYYNKLKRYITEITPQVADSIVKYADWITVKSQVNKELFKFTANWIALHYKEAPVMGRETVCVFMIEKFWTPELAFWEKDYEIQRIRAQGAQMKLGLIGQTGKDIKGLNENGQPVALYDMTAPVRVLYIFSYDCDNCKKETPKLMKTYREWKDKGMDLFTLCLDGDTIGWKSYLKQNGMNSRNIFDPENKSNFRGKYYVDHTPEMYVFDRNWKIIASNIGSESLPKLIEKESAKH